LFFGGRKRKFPGKKKMLRRNSVKEALCAKHRNLGDQKDSLRLSLKGRGLALIEKILVFRGGGIVRVCLGKESNSKAGTGGGSADKANRFGKEWGH